MYERIYLSNRLVRTTATLFLPLALLALFLAPQVALADPIGEGDIVIVKDVIPDSCNRPWNFEAEGNLSPTEFTLRTKVTLTQTFENLTAGGIYTFTEIGVPNGWEPPEISCVVEGAGGSGWTVLDAVPWEPGQDHGDECDGDHDDHEAGGHDEGSHDPGLVNAAEHEEGGRMNYGVRVNLEPGDTVTCTFVNKRKPQIRVYKFEDTDNFGTWDEPESPLPGWEMLLFKWKDGAWAQIKETKTTNDQGFVTFGGLKPSDPEEQFLVCERQQDEWLNTKPGDQAVTPPSGHDDLACQYVTVQNQYGERAEVEFGNVEEAEIYIVKNALPPDGTSFDFAGSIAPFSLIGSTDPTENSKEFTALLPGTYTFTETLPNQTWHLTDVTCVLEPPEPKPTIHAADTQAPDYTVDGEKLTVNAEPGEKIVCTFTNERPMVLLTESYGVSSVQEGQLTGEGSLACYWITLNTKPTGDVTIDISPQYGFVSADKSSVKLTPGNWNIIDATHPITYRDNFVCLRAPDDDVDNASDQVCKDKNDEILGQGAFTGQECGDLVDFVAHQISASGDPLYSTATPFGSNANSDLDNNKHTVDTMVREDDQAAVLLEESLAISDVDEGTDSVAGYTVRLGSRPSADVTVQIAPDFQVVTTKTSLIFTPGNWWVPQQVRVRAVDDDVAEGGAPICHNDSNGLLTCGDHLGWVTHTVSSSDAKYNPAPINGNGPTKDSSDAHKVKVLIRDDDDAGLTFDPIAINVLEGSGFEYTVRLMSQPTAEVTVIAGEAVSASAATSTALVFTPTNWRTPQAVSVTIADDDDANGMRTELVQHTVLSVDPVYNSTARTQLPVVVTDDDTAGMLPNVGMVDVSEGGLSAAYTVRLTSRPERNVTVAANADEQTTVSPQSLTFTPENWDTPQSFSVTAVDDALDEDDGHVGIVTHTLLSDDAAYAGLDVAQVHVRIQDNDQAGALVSHVDLGQIAEGEQSRYAVVLSSQPQAEVKVVPVASERVAFGPSVLVFDPDNWRDPQTLTVTVVDDDVDQVTDAQTLTLNHVVISTDRRYHGTVISDVTLTAMDDDVAGATLSHEELSLTVGASATYELRLTTRPTHDVLVTLSTVGGISVSGNCLNQESGNACLLFTPDNWSQGQRVTVTAWGRGETVISHHFVSSDIQYNTLPSAQVNVNIASIPNGSDAFLPLVALR